MSGQIGLGKKLNRFAFGNGLVIRSDGTVMHEQN